MRAASELERPSGFDPLAFTRAAARRHPARTTAESFADTYQVLLAAAVALAYAGAVLNGLLEGLLVESGAVLTRQLSPGTAQLAGEVAVHLALLCAAAAALKLFLRVGPVSATPAQAHWWLGLPVDRRKVLAWPAAAGLARAAATAGLVFVPVAALADPAHGAASVVLGCLAAAGLGAVLFLAGALIQLARLQRPVHRLLSAMVAAVLLVVPTPLAAYAASSAGVESVLPLSPSSWPLLVLHGAAWPLAALAVLVLASAAAAGMLLDRLTAGELVASGQAAGQASAAFYFGDAGVLRGVLAPEGKAKSWFAPAGKPASAFRILIEADALAFLRAPARTGWILLCGLLPAAVANIAGAGSAVLVGMSLLASAGIATAGTSAAARSWAARPALEAGLPISKAGARLAHAVLPAVLLAGWAAVAFGTLLAMGATRPLSLALGAVAALGLAGAAVRGAYRPEPGWADPAAVPWNYLAARAASSYLAGPDFTFVAVLPVLAAILTGEAGWWLVPLQLACSGFCLWRGTRDRGR
ncbi:DUF6297 family protein [Arthrobacter mangrovi]|uniref:ABC-2 type transport system permease protein n=1 Tax=Arthrobacter mangrovi TaxID=2966350 RepID=A0ABQ5MT01_9MICC|nr:DUF6297 family protein [Arthrobacter mangrovi]GLB67078.1 hypothetical protein AHIS1636_15170 [Arthrobacter mangrovi]